MAENIKDASEEEPEEALANEGGAIQKEWDFEYYIIFCNFSKIYTKKIKKMKGIILFKFFKIIWYNLLELMKINKLLKVKLMQKIGY